MFMPITNVSLDELNTFEKELVLRFQKHRESGSTWYPHDLKQMVFNAFECEMSQERIMNLCQIPMSLVSKWYHAFKEPSAPQTHSQFREIRVVHNPLNKNVTEKFPIERPETKVDLERSASLQKGISIMFPNGVQISGNPDLFSKSFLQDLFLLKGE